MKLLFTAFVFSTALFASPIEFDSVELDVKSDTITLKGVTPSPMHFGLKFNVPDSSTVLTEIELEGIVNDLAGACIDNRCKFEYRFSATAFDRFPAHILHRLSMDRTFRPARPRPVNIKGKDGLEIKGPKGSVKLSW